MDLIEIWQPTLSKTYHKKKQRSEEHQTLLFHCYTNNYPIIEGVEVEVVQAGEGGECVWARTSRAARVASREWACGCQGG